MNMSMTVNTDKESVYKQLSKNKALGFWMITSLAATEKPETYRKIFLEASALTDLNEQEWTHAAAFLHSLAEMIGTVEVPDEQ